jgi:hypothetical protein
MKCMLMVKRRSIRTIGAALTHAGGPIGGRRYAQVFSSAAG